MVDEAGRESTHKLQHPLGVNQVILHLRIKATEEIQWRLELRQVCQQCDEHGYLLKVHSDLVGIEVASEQRAQRENAILNRIEEVQ